MSCNIVNFRPFNLGGFPFHDAGPLPGGHGGSAAIGQKIAEASLTSQDGIKFEGNYIDVDPVTAHTSKLGVFAGGDATEGPGTVVAAIADGESEGKALDVKDLKKIHRWMSQDISLMLPSSAGESEIITAQQKCIIGQPVSFVKNDGGFGVLRIALSAPLVCSMAKNSFKFDSDIAQSVQQELNNDRVVLEKLSLIGKYYQNFVG